MIKTIRIGLKQCKNPASTADDRWLFGKNSSNLHIADSSPRQSELDIILENGKYYCDYRGTKTPIQSTEQIVKLDDIEISIKLQLPQNLPDCSSPEKNADTQFPKSTYLQDTEMTSLQKIKSIPHKESVAQLGALDFLNKSSLLINHFDSSRNIDLTNNINKLVHNMEASTTHELLQ